MNMSEQNSTAPDGRPGVSAPLPQHPASEFRFVLVEYASSPDQGTIHPRDPVGELTTTWITADREDFIDLSARQ